VVKGLTSYTVRIFSDVVVVGATSRQLLRSRLSSVKKGRGFESVEAFSGID